MIEQSHITYSFLLQGAADKRVGAAKYSRLGPAKFD